MLPVIINLMSHISWISCWLQSTKI